MKEYDPKEIESRWQKEWNHSGIYNAEDSSDKPKYYTLIEFPFLSGEGLHVGHLRPYIGMDVVARKRRMQGYNSLYPIGWDAFGLPAENYAIKTGIKPAATNKKNIENYKKQLNSAGISFDWSREVDTADPAYYKWTQWIFLKFFENGLAYKAKMPINWCPKDKIGLANEEVIDGKCERCGTEVIQKEKEQWMLAITKYADRLDKDLDTVDYPEAIKTQQRNWIGKSEGAMIKFDDIEVFTTRPDTIYGATFIVVSGKEDKFTGRYVTNPATQEQIPVWEAEYVLPDYGTGAIMGVPADDERDHIFAEKHGLPIIKDYPKADFEDFGTKVTKFKLRDWVFSRQRYWGEPIPVVYCEKDGWVAIPETELPLTLPEVEKYEPTDSGESPLSSVESWVNTTCPKCGGFGKRETDTMPNWAGSSWYFLRYIDPRNDEELASPQKLNYWLPVDWYNGDTGHTTLHLLYSRFWYKFLSDLKLVPGNEPYKKRTSHGHILAEGGGKMSKSKPETIIDPASITERFGADTLRVYEMFMGPFKQAIPWSEDSLVGPRRFIERVWLLRNKVSGNSHSALMHQTIKKVSDDIEALGFNTAVSALMIYANALEKQEKVSSDDYETLLKLFAPFAPHMTEELWHELGHNTSIHLEPWPTYDESKLVSDEVTIIVQVNGKMRAKFTASKEVNEEQVLQMAENLPEVKKWVGDNSIERRVYVPRKLVNLVTT